MNILKNYIYPILIISYRDILKFTHDRARIIATFIFPFVFIGVLGKSLQANLGASTGINFLEFTFTGVLVQTLFQSAATGVVSLIEDRDNDFSQELFVSPISRYVIIGGKIIGESIVALMQAVGIIIFALISGIHFSLYQFVTLFPTLILICLVGGAFGVLVLSQLKTERAANQIFPFIFLPQLFIAGVFAPIKSLPIYLDILSKIAPLTYVIDLFRGLYFKGNPSYDQIILRPVWLNMIVVMGMFFLFLILGTILFVRNEKNK